MEIAASADNMRTTEKSAEKEAQKEVEVTRPVVVAMVVMVIVGRLFQVFIALWLTWNRLITVKLLAAIQTRHEIQFKEIESTGNIQPGNH